MPGAYRTADATCPAHGAVAITPSDATEFPPTRSIYVGVSGNIAVTMVDGQTVTFLSVPIGIIALQVIKVLATGTTATDMIALY